MTLIDRWLQRIRFSKVKSLVKDEFDILDVGSQNGELFHYLGKKGGTYLGIDPLASFTTQSNFSLLKGRFPEGLPDKKDCFDSIIMLAIIEHFDQEVIGKLNEVCTNLLKSGGLIIITVPSPVVDKILEVLKFLRIIDAETLHEHHGFIPDDLLKIFSPDDYKLIKREKFEFGLNNFFVFKKYSR